ncbi:MAG: DUF378 domain-containing protein [Candidatus Magasanikbacteria bacterium]|nr:DUF378 domain-containing protein [Candidatus Magasanikbacteria bacterium]
MGKNKGLHIVAFLLVIIGGLNWLLQGVFQWEVGALFGGTSSVVARVIYILVGLASVYLLATHKGDCKACETKPAGM